MQDNLRAGIAINQPKTFAERTTVARKMCAALKITMPCLVDDMENGTALAYSAWPDRIYLVGLDGRIVYKGEPGPPGFDPPEAVAALKKYLKTADYEKEMGRARRDP